MLSIIYKDSHGKRRQILSNYFHALKVYNTHEERTFGKLLDF
jgi:hypothetical protein